MKTTDAMFILGKKLEEKYKEKGFKYRKSDRSLIKRGKKFYCLVSFFSFSGNTKEKIRLDTCLIINENNDKTQPFYMSLWENGIYLNIATEQLIEEAFKVIYEYIEKDLLVEFKKMEQE